MIFADNASPPPSEARELLAWWSDVLGIAGFVFSVVGVAIAVFIKQEVSRANREATAKVLNVVRLRTHWESHEARQALLSAREACSARSWGRAEVHFEAAVSMLERIILSDDLPADLRDQLRRAVDGVRALGDEVRGRTTKGDLLTNASIATLRDTIATTGRVEAHFTGKLTEGGA